jgi:hypothetical protein
MGFETGSILRFLKKRTEGANGKKKVFTGTPEKSRLKGGFSDPQRKAVFPATEVLGNLPLIPII